MKKFSVLLLICTLAIGTIMAQDARLSQYYSQPLMYNPALTGAIDGNLRVNLAYRQQWAAISPYSTFVASIDGVAGKTKQQAKLKGDFFGVGVVAIQDFQGDFDDDNNIVTTNAVVSFAYHKQISSLQKQYLSIGVQAGYVQRVFGADHLFPNQFERGQNTDPQIDANETTARNYDINAGLTYYAQASSKIDFTAGLGLFHINRPELSGLKESRDREHMRLTVNASARFAIRENLSFSPTFLVQRQGSALTSSFGGMLGFGVDAKGLYGVQVGAHFRAVGAENERFSSEAAVLALQLEANNLAIGYSYDINLSSLSEATTNADAGSHEVYLRFVLPFKKMTNDEGEQLDVARETYYPIF